jgi:hypothetical protein
MVKIRSAVNQPGISWSATNLLIMAEPVAGKIVHLRSSLLSKRKSRVWTLLPRQGQWTAAWDRARDGGPTRRPRLAFPKSICARKGCGNACGRTILCPCRGSEGFAGRRFLGRRAGRSSHALPRLPSPALPGRSSDGQAEIDLPAFWMISRSGFARPEINRECLRLWLRAKPHAITLANCATPHDGRIHTNVALIVLDRRAQDTGIRRK